MLNWTINNTVKHLFSFLIFLFAAMPSAFAQSMQTEMADQFRQDGKIYVVIAVMSIVFLGIIIYLFYLDRKLSKLEKTIKETP
jgi:CcmD family protein